MSGFVCHGCGTELPPKTWQGRDPKWCSERCRKASYGDPCVDCGVRTISGAEHARVPEPRCAPCASAHRIVWTEQRIIDRIREWKVLHGDAPAQADWGPTKARVLHDEARARRFEEADGYWPWFTVVVRVFGSWNRGITAAGFMSRAPVGDVANHQRRRNVQKVAA